MPEEIWKCIPTFDKYEVSNKERLKYISGNKIREYKNFGCNRRQLINNEDKIKMICFNRLVALAFLPNPENLPFVLHIKGKSNVPENLKWGKKGEQGKNENIIRPKKLNVVPIERLDDKGNVLETYNDRESLIKWVRENCKTKMNDGGIETHIYGVCSNYKISAFGYKWRYEFKKIDGEEWKKHPDAQLDKYEFSTEGRCFDGTRLIIGYLDRDGYKLIMNYYLHKLIAETFLANPNNLPQVNHKNKNRADCRVCNLEWISGEDNINHAHAKKIYQYSKDRQTLIKEYKSITIASIETNCHRSAVSNCAMGKYKSAGGFYWSYTRLT